MEIHLSLGVSTIVALMAAHREGKPPEMRTACDLADLDCLRAIPRAGKYGGTRDGDDHPVG